MSILVPGLPVGDGGIIFNGPIHADGLRWLWIKTITFMDTYSDQYTSSKKSFSPHWQVMELSILDVLLSNIIRFKMSFKNNRISEFICKVTISKT